MRWLKRRAASAKDYFLRHSGRRNTLIARLPKLGHESFDEKHRTISKDLVRLAERLDYTITPSSPERGTIVLCSMFLGDAYRKKLALCLESRRRYCEANGYAFAEMSSAPRCFDRADAWMKVPFLYRLMSDGYRKIYYLDADTFVTNHAVKLESFFSEMEDFHPPKSLLFSRDASNCLNSGSFFTRSNRASQSFLSLAWEMTSHVYSPPWEQQPFQQLYEEFDAVQQVVEVCPNARKFNAFDPYWGARSAVDKWVPVPIRDNSLWEPGDFIIHFAAMGGEILNRSMEKYRAYAFGKDTCG